MAESALHRNNSPTFERLLLWYFVMAKLFSFVTFWFALCSSFSSQRSSLTGLRGKRWGVGGGGGQSADLFNTGPNLSGNNFVQLLEFGVKLKFSLFFLLSKYNEEHRCS